MSVWLGTGGKVLLGPDGKVATSSDCCCATGDCCAFRVSATGEGMENGIPFSCTLEETLVLFDCCNPLGSTYLINTDCADPGNPPGFMQVNGGVTLSGGVWTLTIRVGAFGNITGSLDIGDDCIGGPLEISGDAFPPTELDSAFYTGSVETIHVECPACDPCTPNEGPLDPDCDPCVAAVCAEDPYCCDTQWDSTCVSETSLYCDPDPCAGLADDHAPSIFQKISTAVTATGRIVKAKASGQKVLVTAEEQARRLEICKGCEFFTGTTCRKCGCIARFKANLATEKCPIGKW